MRGKKYYIYILTNFKKTVLYIGFTSNLQQRVEQHKAFEVEGFTKKYKIDRLIYYEVFNEIQEAKMREKAMKKWNRAWKEELIEKSNPHWNEIVIIE